MKVRPINSHLLKQRNISQEVIFIALPFFLGINLQTDRLVFLVSDTGHETSLIFQIKMCI